MFPDNQLDGIFPSYIDEIYDDLRLHRDLVHHRDHCYVRSRRTQSSRSRNKSAIQLKKIVVILEVKVLKPGHEVGEKIDTSIDLHGGEGFRGLEAEVHNSSCPQISL